MEGTGLYAYGFRYYDPVIGRFTGVDPIADQFAFVSPFNYAENSPIANIDLHGLQRFDVTRNQNFLSVSLARGTTDNDPFEMIVDNDRSLSVSPGSSTFQSISRLRESLNWSTGINGRTAGISPNSEFNDSGFASQGNFAIRLPYIASDITYSSVAPLERPNFQLSNVGISRSIDVTVKIPGYDPSISLSYQIGTKSFRPGSLAMRVEGIRRKDIAREISNARFNVSKISVNVNLPSGVTAYSPSFLNTPGSYDFMGIPVTTTATYDPDKPYGGTVNLEGVGKRPGQQFQTTINVNIGNE